MSKGAYVRERKERGLYVEREERERLICKREEREEGERERKKRERFFERVWVLLAFLKREREERDVTIFCRTLESNVTHVLVTCRIFINVSKYRCTKPINPPGPS
jgi:hypothetical protein